jgi:osmotically-inducible protein OsmY
MSVLNEHLEHHVNQKLLANQELSSQRINVVADAGEITLHGCVQSYRRKLAAEEIAIDDENVHVVRNELVVATPEAHAPAFLAELVNRLLDNDGGLSNESIMVNSKGNTLTLSGYASSEIEKTRIADVAASVDGVRKVANMLVVNPVEVARNRQHCLEILESLNAIIGFSSRGLRLSVVNESARLSGWVAAAWMKETAETTVRSYGILTLTNDINLDPVV